MVDEFSIICKAIPEFTKEQIKDIYDKAQADESKKKLWDSLDIIKKIEVIRHTLKPQPQFEEPEEVPTGKSRNTKGQTIGMNDSPNNSLVKMFGVSIAIGMVVFVIVSLQFVTNSSFNRSINTMKDEVAKAVKGVEDTRTSLANQIANIPGMITQQTSGMSNQISQVSQQINSVNTDLSNKINNIQSSTQSTISQSVADIKKSNDSVLSSVNTSLKNITDNVSSSQALLQTQIDSLKNQFATFQNQTLVAQSLANLSVSGTSNNITTPIPPLIISNSNSVAMDTTNVTVILTITPPVGTTITSPSYIIQNSSGLVSTTVFLKTTLGALGITNVVPGTINILPPNIPLIATPSANATSSWLAVWSKN